MPHHPRRRSARGGERRSAPEPLERLQKVLARAGLASRREAEEWIRAGRLTVNGEPASLGVRVGPDDQVRLDGRLVRQRAAPGGGAAFVYHRSSGERLDEVSEGAAEDSVPLLERLPRRAGRRFIVVSPMPRIDGGLELLCADGEYAARLQRRVRRWVSAFSVRVLGELTQTQLEGILGGALDSGVRLEVLGCEAAGGEATNRWYALRARGASGKDVRQLLERQGARVSRVLRTQLGSLMLERSLPRGHFRALAPDELEALLAPPTHAAAGSRLPG